MRKAQSLPELGLKVITMEFGSRRTRVILTSSHSARHNVDLYIFNNSSTSAARPSVVMRGLWLTSALSTSKLDWCQYLDERSYCGKVNKSGSKIMFVFFFIKRFVIWDVVKSFFFLLSLINAWITGILFCWDGHS